MPPSPPSPPKLACAKPLPPVPPAVEKPICSILSMYCAPMLLVMMMIVLRKLTLRPLASVK